MLCSTADLLALVHRACVYGSVLVTQALRYRQLLPDSLLELREQSGTRKGLSYGERSLDSVAAESRNPIPKSVLII